MIVLFLTALLSHKRICKAIENYHKFGLVTNFLSMSNQLPGILALIGSTWLFVGTYVEGRMLHLSDSWFTGVWGILFISGWICATIALTRLGGIERTTE